MENDLLTLEQEKGVGVRIVSCVAIDEVSSYDGFKESYRGLDLEIGFSCVCDDEPDGFCGDIFYFKYKGQYFLSRYVFGSREKAVADGKEAVDKFLNILEVK